MNYGIVEELRRWERNKDKPFSQPPKKPLSEDDERHGTENGYQNYRCRCPECTNAHRLYCAGRR